MRSSGVVELVKGSGGGSSGVAGYGGRKDGFEFIISGPDANFLSLSPRKAAKNKNAGTCCFIFHSRN